MIKENELPIATDDECKQLREHLLNKNVIKAAGKNDVVMVKNNIVINTKKTSLLKRKELISKGIISDALYDIPKSKGYVCEEKGEYVVKPINNDVEYKARKSVYFRMMQEILQSRQDLKLILGPKNSKDPDCFF